MRVVLNVSDPDPRNVALLARWHLEGIVLANRLFLRRNWGRVPDLYASGIRFRNEPWAGGQLQIEEFARYEDLLQPNRLWADCAQLVAARVAWQREKLWRALTAAGMPEAEADRRARAAYGIKIYWRIYHEGQPNEVRLFHVQVRNPDGSVEDPSRLLEWE